MKKKSLLFLVALFISIIIFAQEGGTCFALSENGYVITNYHVIENAKNINIRGINGDFKTYHKAEVIKYDKINDAAILKIIDKSLIIKNIPYSFRSKRVKLGESVFVMGYPLFTTLGDNIRVSTGIISSMSGFKIDNDDLWDNVSENFNSFLITTPINSGNSGGPLFDEDGNVIGVVNARLLSSSNIQNVGNAIKLSAIQGLFDQFDDLKLSEHNTVKPKSFTDKLQNLKQFIYIIEIDKYTDNFADTKSSKWYGDYKYQSKSEIDTANIIDDILYDNPDFKTIVSKLMCDIMPGFKSTDPINYIVEQPINGNVKTVTTKKYAYYPSFGKFNREISEDALVEYFNQNQNIEKTEIYNSYGSLKYAREYKYKNNILQSIELYRIGYYEEKGHYGSVVLERDKNNNIIIIKCWYYNKEYYYFDYDEDYNKISEVFDFSKGLLCKEDYFEYDIKIRLFLTLFRPIPS